MATNSILVIVIFFKLPERFSLQKILIFTDFSQVANALRELIAKDQCIPGNMMRALLDRFYESPSKDKVK